MTQRSDIFYVNFGLLNRGVIGQRRISPAPQANEESRMSGLLRIEETATDATDAPGRTMAGSYSCRDVSRLFDINEGRLRYWDRSGFLPPSGHDGRRRCYTFQDLVGIRSAKTLLDQGVSLQRVRRVLSAIREKLPRSPHPLNRLRVMSDLKTVVVTCEDREFEASTGQLLLDFEVRAIEEKIIAELPSRRSSVPALSAYDWYLEGCRLDEDEATFAQAEEAYFRAIHLDPTLANAYTNLGNLLYRKDAVRDAQALYEKAIEVDPNQPEAHYNLGFIEFEAGRFEDAEKSFSKAVELDSTFADAHFNSAMTCFELGAAERARQHLEQYLELEPSGSWAEIARLRLRELS